jgi:hypothetical protein
MTGAACYVQTKAIRDAVAGRETVDGITEQPRITRRRDATAKTG